MTSEQVTPKLINLDMRGQVCPACLLVAMDALNRHRDALNNGLETLCIKTDNREATTTIPTTARSMGYPATVTRIDSFYQISIGRFITESRE
ncbi:MAG: sulfurtransferase TusA family protein [Desulfocapsaceae bacterium]|jgi:TusA-related sulfurtransferase|nr:sulfurtransferase TusA family protein [Desulfocapsaceae bacterium]MDP3696048.1 sulfurtransferase TusA family protein [Desulfocapsaceae bacterium]